jgi:hypothetical protein
MTVSRTYAYKNHLPENNFSVSARECYRCEARAGERAARISWKDFTLFVEPLLRGGEGDLGQEHRVHRRRDVVQHCATARG